MSLHRREKAIRDLLLRSAPKLDDWTTRGMAGSLKIPLTWVSEAKVSCNNHHEFDLWRRVFPTHSETPRRFMP